MVYALESELLVSPFIIPVILLYIVRYETPFKEFRLKLI